MKKFLLTLAGRFAFSALLLTALADLVQAKPPVTFTSPCECEGNHGVSRWGAKTDAAQPPSSNIKQITPSEIYKWKGPGGQIPTREERLPAENHWFAVTGRVEKIKAEDDGDVHIELANVDGKPGAIVVELPLGPAWCEMRKTAFSWTGARFPVFPGKEQTLHLREHPIVTVVGRAFYDIDHARGDTHSNRRNYNQALAVWEIHPVMRLVEGSAQSAEVAPASAESAPAIATPNEHSAGEFVTLTRPVTIQVPYGTTVLKPGMKLPVLSRDSQSVDVRYLDARYSIPISSTDSQ
jgi:hypothetical protein